ncbi:MAG: indolepyruvate ferredoxin oxidoreductase family protein [Alphaproteobacteria bacterium TMED89]|nr:indolepyruvate ferredoxin oxidoreductase [Rhodospirillaceae bacterium]RPH10874.1 MAG: indolepyruvate ferredoxin oxidoreductase family protein [Alphaproteobacteria bacterium TMED89]
MPDGTPLDATQRERLASVTLEDKFSQSEGVAFMTGTQALLRIVMDQARRDRAAGLRTGGFVSGYRGSPLGNVDLTAWRAQPHMDEYDIKFQEGLNEDLAATSIWGTQQVGIFDPTPYDGVFSLWYGKGPGVDRSGDALKHGNLAGTSPNGGVLLALGDDHTSKSSTTAHQSEPMLIGMGIPVLNPASIHDFLPLGLFGYAASRFAGTWAGLKCLTDTVESSGAVKLVGEELEFVTPSDFDMPPEGVSIRHPDSMLAQEERLWSVKLPAFQAFTRVNRINHQTHGAKTGRMRLGIVGVGKGHLEARDALGMLGMNEADLETLGIGLFKVVQVWPLEPQSFTDFAMRCDELLVVEEKRPLVEDQAATLVLKAATEGPRPVLSGKRDPEGQPLLPAHGEFGALEVTRAIDRRLVSSNILPDNPDRVGRLMPAPSIDRGNAPAPQRMPWYCAGCPHNTSTKVVEGSKAGSGIGCHTLALYIYPERTTAYTHMGAEGTPWIGMSPFVDTPHMFQNMGDGTYNHSGLLAIRAAIASGVNMTYKILFNDAVALTGGQTHEGGLTPWGITQQLTGEGATKIIVVADDPDKYARGTPWAKGVTIRPREEMEAVQKELREVEGVTILLYDQVCAAEKRRRRKRGTMEDPAKRLFINTAVCEGCGDCGVKSNCVAIKPFETPLGRKREIDQSVCNKDYSCLKGFCPSFVTVSGEEANQAAIRPPETGPKPQLPTDPLPAPAPQVWEGEYNMLVTGIGGTGVTTVSALLGMAAHLDGLGSALLDQTGLSQKNGAVSSHVRLLPKGGDAGAPKVSPASLDLLLGCDLVVSTAPQIMATYLEGRTKAVINDHVVPIALFTRQPDMPMQSAPLTKRIAGSIRNEDMTLVNATTIATKLLGDSIASNLFLVGVALQLGQIPLSVEAVERAIELNGVAVPFNKQALAWGRWMAIDPGMVTQAALGDELEGLDEDEGVKPPTREERVTMLTAYQNSAYARRFTDAIEAFESKLAGRTTLTSATPRLVAAAEAALHRAMAYKDEYEVARLYTDGTYEAEMKAKFGPTFALTFHLSPPLLAKTDPNTGEPQKIAFSGRLVMPLLRVLASLRGLRGGPLDLLGRTEERRSERAFIERVEGLLDSIAEQVTQENAASAEAIIEATEHVRGFGPVKARNLAEFNAKLPELMQAMSAPSGTKAA